MSPSSGLWLHAPPTPRLLGQSRTCSRIPPGDPQLAGRLQSIWAVTMFMEGL